MSGRYPGYDTDVKPYVFVICPECGKRYDRANILHRCAAAAPPTEEEAP